jgi:hypothetical protein
VSYFVIKGPAENSQYLCIMPGQNCPQWFERAKAERFPDAESAWKFLDAVQKKHPDAWYQGRVVRVNTLRDWKAERAQLRRDVANWRAVADLRQGEIARLREEPEKLHDRLRRIEEVTRSDADPDARVRAWEIAVGQDRRPAKATETKEK